MVSPDREHDVSEVEARVLHVHQDLAVLCAPPPAMA